MCSWENRLIPRFAFKSMKAQVFMLIIRRQSHQKAIGFMLQMSKGSPLVARHCQKKRPGVGIALDRPSPHGDQIFEGLTACRPHPPPRHFLMGIWRRLG